jgi:hypothetical protein
MGFNMFRTIVYPVVILFFLFGLIKAGDVTFTSSNLPIVIIDTHDQAILDARRIVADMDIIDNGPGKRNDLIDPPNNYHGKISIELRGSSSLQFPKKQYAFETQDTSGNNRNISLLGLPEENDWVLYAPYSDKSLMRNVLVFWLANEMGGYAPRTRFVELVLNDSYMGVYVLMEKIKRDRNRVNITEMDTLDIAGDDVTGGYILKVDKTAGEEVSGWTSDFAPYPGDRIKTFYQYHYPRPRDITNEQEEYIKNYITGFEQLMASPGYQHPDTGYAKYLHVESFIDHIIINEVSKNVDAYRLSAFMYKDRDSQDTKLTMGPVWDFNLAFGNANYYTAESTYGIILEYFLNSEEFHNQDSFHVPFWWGKLWDDPQFRNRLYHRWWTLRQDVLDVERMLAYINSTVAFLNEAQQRNFQKWEIFGTYVWPNAFIGVDYQEEIDYLKTWIQDRIQWIDDNIYHLYTGTASVESNPVADQYIMGQNYPNPFNTHTIIPIVLPKNSRIKVEIFDIVGQKVLSLLDAEWGAGTYSLKWDGKDIFGNSVPSGVYICRLRMGSFTTSKKMLYLQ